MTETDDLFDPRRLDRLWRRSEEELEAEAAPEPDEEREEPEAALVAFDELERQLTRALGPRVATLRVHLDRARVLLVEQLGERRAKEAAAAAAAGEAPAEEGGLTPNVDTLSQTASGIEHAGDGDGEGEAGEVIEGVGENASELSEEEDLAARSRDLRKVFSASKELEDKLDEKLGGLLEGPALESNKTDLGGVLDDIEDLYGALKLGAR